MTKALSTLAILSAIIASPAFAQNTGVQEPTHHVRTHGYRNFRGAYDQLNAPVYAAPRAFDRSDINGFGFRGRDPSWVGDRDPSLRPAGT
jgi:hypothetical protein